MLDFIILFVNDPALMLAVHHTFTEDRIDELKVIFLEEEIKELKHALRESRNRNNYLSQLLEQAEDVKKKQ